MCQRDTKYHHMHVRSSTFIVTFIVVKSQVLKVSAQVKSYTPTGETSTHAEARPAKAHSYVIPKYHAKYRQPL
jgi:hypothetical protein